jgi:hypothetical protein
MLLLLTPFWVGAAGMPTNIALLRHSLCANPRLAERLCLAQVGTCNNHADCMIGIKHALLGDVALNVL